MSEIAVNGTLSLLETDSRLSGMLCVEHFVEETEAAGSDTRLEVASASPTPSLRQDAILFQPDAKRSQRFGDVLEANSFRRYSADDRRSE